ncbi:peptidase M20 domain-containing protein 2-like [Halichondria panicea]|uniref:peptidase M20 domain-containing protein 2-like n=1 Tax=Halichondria panicea TaxID=6063 RepID=UPI00312B8DD9
MDLKNLVSKKINDYAEKLFFLSNEVWKNPELNFKEFKAHELLTNFLEKEGFTVERSYTGIETAFRATFGSGRPNVCVICEYDALPKIGHACGHNLIAEAGIAAGLGLKAVLESSDAPKGMLTIMGTPAEEGGGGKIKLIKNGAFENIDFAMMVHPSPKDVVMSDFVCLCPLDITYTGKAAHAAAFPWEGVNALDAAVMAYTSISALRQQMKPTWRVHGIITNGGAKPNIIPEKAAMEYYIRAPSMSDLDLLKSKVTACFKSAATATGCEVEICEPADTFASVKHNDTLAKLYYRNIVDLGVKDMILEENLGGSTDMGNVSYIVPSIHPMFAIGSGEVNHTREFTAAANTPEAHTATLIAAKAMAHTCIDVLTTDGLMEKIKDTFKD